MMGCGDKNFKVIRWASTVALLHRVVYDISVIDEKATIMMRFCSTILAVTAY